MSHPIQEKIIALIGKKLSIEQLSAINSITKETDDELATALKTDNFNEFFYYMAIQFDIPNLELIQSTYQRLSQELKTELRPHDSLPQIPQEPLPPIPVVEDATLAINENERKQAKIKMFTEEMKKKRVGIQPRIPAILDRGGKAEGLLKRENYMLTSAQVFFVRKMQLEAALNSAKSQKNVGAVPDPVRMARGMILSHETHPEMFTQSDPVILIGDNGEAVMLCEYVASKSKPGTYEKAVLGEGANGAVYIGQQLDTGDFCIIKDMFAVGDDEAIIEFKKEHAMLDELNRLIDTIHVTHMGKEKLFGTQELAWGKDFFKFLGIERGEHIDHSLTERLDMYIKFIEKLDELHKVDKKLHRDVKVENVVWDEVSKTAKLVDVGMTENMDKNGRFIGEDTPVGTACYMAPEILAQWRNGQNCVYSIETEAYAAGMLGCEMFSANDLALAAHELLPNLRDFKGYRVTGLSKSLEKADIFKPDPNRTPAEQSLFDELAKLVEIDVTKRTSISSAIENLKQIQAELMLEQVFAMEPEEETSPADPNLTDRGMSNGLRKSVLDLNKEAEALLTEIFQRPVSKNKVIFTQQRASQQECNTLEKVVENTRELSKKRVISINDLDSLSNLIVNMNIEHQKSSLTNSHNSKRMTDFIDSSNSQLEKLYQATKEYQIGQKLQPAQENNDKNKSSPGH